MDKDTYIFRKEWLEYMQLLTCEEKLEVREAIDSYALNGVDVSADMSRVVKVVFCCIKGSIDRDRQKYEDARERNRANGALGGRPRKQTQEKPAETQNNPVVFSGSENKKIKTQETPILYPDSCSMYPDSNYYYSSGVCACEESAGNPAKISEEEKQKIFEMFFFRNFEDPWRQAEKFIAHNSARGWTDGRYAFDTPEKRMNLALNWEQKGNPDAKRFGQWFIDPWKRAYSLARYDPDIGNQEVADEMLNKKVDARLNTAGYPVITCGKRFEEWYRSNIKTVAPIFRGISDNLKFRSVKII